jgi:hypothetical protein
MLVSLFSGGRVEGRALAGSEPRATDEITKTSSMRVMRLSPGLRL